MHVPSKIILLGIPNATRSAAQLAFWERIICNALRVLGEITRADFAQLQQRHRLSPDWIKLVQDPRQELLDAVRSIGGTAGGTSGLVLQVTRNLPDKDILDMLRFVDGQTVNRHSTTGERHYNLLFLDMTSRSGLPEAAASHIGHALGLLQLIGKGTYVEVNNGSVLPVGGTMYTTNRRIVASAARFREHIVTDAMRIL